MSDFVTEYERLIESAQEAFAQDQLNESLERFRRASTLAEASGDQDRADRAECSGAYVRIELGEGASVIPELRQLYLRTADARNKWSAVYTIAVAYDVQGDLENACDWSRRAADLVQRIDDEAASVRTHNLAGVLALRHSEFERAEQCFASSLELNWGLKQPHERADRANVTANLGYSMMCTERLTEGLDLCEQARAALEAENADHFLYENLQDLCYGYILDDRLEQAQECGERAFDLAVAHSDDAIAKNCLFLLSEVAVRRGDTFRARRYLRELTTYYPEVGVSEDIIDVFLNTDLTQVVNLRG